MSEPFIAEIKIISWNFPPKGWAFCNGQLLPINQNQALFAILGTTYGGDGRTTFGLPNLQGRTPVHVGSGINLGQVGGEEGHTLQLTELPTHTHLQIASSAAPDKASPAGNIAATESNSAYSNQAANTTMAGPTSSVGGSQAHSNTQPYLVLNFVVALQGIFPSQN